MWRLSSERDMLSARVRDLIGRRARAIWEQEGRPANRTDDLVRRARAEVEREFHRRIAEIGVYPHRWNPPLEVEEALTPGQSREPGGLKWASGSGTRGI